MHVLHISSGFCNSKVHANLYMKLAENRIVQTVYCPVRSEEELGKNAFIFDNTSIIHDKVIRPFHRYAYHLKCYSIFRSLRKKVNFKEFDLIHASTLFTDGGVAYRIAIKHNIPFVVTVRSTDVNVFLKRAPHTWLSARKTLLCASKIIFVSPALRDKFYNHSFIKRFLSDIEEKIVVSRNGIDDYWIDNVNRNYISDNHCVLYVGTMIRRKRPLLVIEAVLSLKNKFPDIKLNIIGATGEDEDAVKEYSKNNPGVIVYHGRINEKPIIKDFYRNSSVFALPSTGETFGLVYLESLSQNLPVIYTKGEGIDGFLADNNGIGLSMPSEESIKKAIKMIFDNKEHYSNINIDFELFRWSVIASEYVNMYSKIITDVREMKKSFKR